MRKIKKTKCPSASVLFSIALKHPVEAKYESHARECQACKQEIERLGKQINLLRTATWSSESE